jgi:hypothetical protein
VTTRLLGLVADALGMNLLNERSLRFLFPARERETDQGVMETCERSGSSCAGGLNFSPRIFHLQTYPPLVFVTQVHGAGLISFDDS